MNTLLVDTRAKLTIMEADLQNHSTEMESMILKSKKQSNDLHAMNSRVTDVSRQIENINEPENNALSSLKGEFKIIRQNCKLIGDDLKSLHENVVSNKNSVSNLRSKLAIYEQQVGKIKSVQSFCESSKPHTPTSATPVSYSDAVQREEQAAVRHSPPIRPVFHVRDFFGAESHGHQRAIYCHFHEHLNQAKVYHVIQVMMVSTPVNFHSSETSTRAHMVGNNEYNNTNTFPTRKVE